jgi:hypothetical protein
MISRRQFWHYVRGLVCDAQVQGQGVAYDGGGLGGFDGQAVGFDGGAGAFLVGLLVLALDLVGVSRCAVFREGRERRTRSFLEIGMVNVSWEVLDVRVSVLRVVVCSVQLVECR